METWTIQHSNLQPQSVQQKKLQDEKENILNYGR